MESFFKSSILFQEFINYRKYRPYMERSVFSRKTRLKGEGLIPVVVDSIDTEISLYLGGYDGVSRYKKYGREYVIKMDLTVNEFTEKITQDLGEGSVSGLGEKIKGKKIRVCLEDSTVLKSTEKMGDIYKKYKNGRDNILYILVTTEQTIYGYIISILRYLNLI
jgi:hypothetical protein